jgi:iron only hydrogenase large subunit-like protein
MSLANAEDIEPLVGDTEGSGSQASALFRDIAFRNFGIKVGAVEYKAGRNPDIREASLVVDGKVVLSVGVANGFRNIQNIVRKLKTGKMHYVEIMACPSGCLNGGGQIRVDNPSDRAASKERLKEVIQVYASITAGSELEEVDKDLQTFYQVVGGSPGSEIAKSLFHTEYHLVPTSDDLVVTNW